jgi:glucose-6-phosphate-specific signal transduction histidine kinase
MRERMAALGGTLELRNDGGAEVVATIPKEKSGVRSQNAETILTPDS